MPVKITTPVQVESLKEGDVLQKSAPYRTHQKQFGKATTEDLVTYEIKGFNRKNQTVSLEIRDNSSMFSWPSDLKRLTIKIEHMITDDTWWIYEQRVISSAVAQIQL